MKQAHHFQNKYALGEYIADIGKKVEDPKTNSQIVFEEINDLLAHIENPMDEMKLYNQKEIVGPLLMFQASLVKNGKVKPNGIEDSKYIVNRWERAAKMGYAEGQNHLGECHLSGEYGIKKDPHLAVELFSEAVESGDVKALWHLGSCYALGLGAPMDMNKAIEYWSQAASLDDAHAKQSLMQYKDAVIQYMKNKVSYGVYHVAYEKCITTQKSMIDAKFNKQKSTDMETYIKEPKQRGKFIGKQIKDAQEQEMLAKLAMKPVKK